VQLACRDEHAAGAIIAALTDETAAYRWAGEHAIRELAAEANAIRILDGLRADATLAVRHQDGTHLP
jgi:8-oxo-dGTP diphosphatase